MRRGKRRLNGRMIISASAPTGTRHMWLALALSAAIVTMVSLAARLFLQTPAWAQEASERQVAQESCRAETAL